MMLQLILKPLPIHPACPLSIPAQNWFPLPVSIPLHHLATTFWAVFQRLMTVCAVVVTSIAITGRRPTLGHGIGAFDDDYDNNRANVLPLSTTIYESRRSFVKCRPSNSAFGRSMEHDSRGQQHTDEPTAAGDCFNLVYFAEKQPHTAVE
ncbi:uncharacterized protein BO96DRAFT_476791 [Aspergillus niger CBS 101883]|uniref:Uncharacterized protein n=2 Tax=Aspergillus niger TaxID=5061 RepID=A2QYY1_ASPNC|nr:uncharacterized protein BO96DRAFT_476791 [Aspergillus niger CBS 101883]XP_059601831.1 hypothetical protein An12g02910 [Aspergillus niger]PYH55682.1 hypothetical protein BO96DRAFT_476791 [Aspergillus niger CBS 101883]CAK41130.1 hypothetical protein An12g02910 [Aspergillus niger]